MKNPIYPCLWFDGNAQEVANFYCSVFKNSRITADTPMVVNFELDGHKFMGLNGGPQYRPNPSISFFVICDTPEEVDIIWDKLLNGGSVMMPLDKYAWSEKYGWVQDRFGVSWQVAFGKIEEVGENFTPTLMFTNQQAGKAEEAIGFYTSIFDNSSVQGILKYSAEDNDVEGTVKHAQFRLDKSVMMAMDSSLSHSFDFNEAISFVIDCENQEQIDYYWNKLTEGGEESMCGWLKDRYGISWQIVPVVLGELMSDSQKAPKVVEAFLKMKKFDIDELMAASVH